jgi:branched-chain amino acid transport system ATP-binding protein
MALLEVKGIVSGYTGEVDVLHDVSLRAEKGEITCVIGPNASGKSTLLKTIYGYLKPRSGSILYGEEDITGWRPHILLGKGIAYVPQERSIFPEMTVEENLKMGAWFVKKSRRQVEAAVHSVYENFRVLEHRKNEKAANLSGGLQRMIELARALLLQPRLLLLDEPTAGLAPIIASEIYDRLVQIRNEGVGILLVDQNVKKSVQIADYVYVMERGRITMEGTRDEFRQGLKDIIRTWLV